MAPKKEEKSAKLQQVKTILAQKDRNQFQFYLIVGIIEMTCLINLVNDD